MTDEQYQALLEQVNANTQAIEEIKEVLAQMNEASMVDNTDLAAYLNQQVELLQAEDKRLAGLISDNTTAITALQEKAHDISYSDGTLTITKEASE